MDLKTLHSDMLIIVPALVCAIILTSIFYKTPYFIYRENILDALFSVVFYTIIFYVLFYVLRDKIATGSQ